MAGRNEIIIADRDIRIYLGECLIQLQKFDQLILKAKEKNKSKLEYIVKILTLYDEVNKTEIKRNNELKIADKELKIYLGECLILFRKFDNIFLSSSDKYIDKSNLMANILIAIGVEIDKEYLNEKNKMLYKTEEVNCFNSKKSEHEKRIFHKLGLKKISNQKGLGIEIDEDYFDGKLGILYKKEVIEEINERSGRRESLTIYKVGITKIPDLFMYTNLKKAIELKDVI